MGEVFRELSRRAECEILDGYFLPDHIHMLVSISPKSSVSNVVGHVKGKSAIHITRHTLVAGRISLASIFGQRVILYQQ